MRKYILTAMILVVLIIGRSFHNTVAQDIDSSTLRQKIDSLSDLAKDNWYANPVAAKKIAEEILELSIKYEFNYGMGRAYNNFGVIEELRGNFAKSIGNYKIAIEHFRLSGDSTSVYSSQYNMALSLQNDKQFAEAKKYVEETLAYASRELDTATMIIYSMTLGNLYINTDESFEEATKHIEQSLYLSQAVEDTVMTCFALSLLADAHLTRSRDIDYAIDLFQRSKFLMEKVNPENHFSLGFTCVGLAKANHIKGRYADALLFSTEAISHYKRLNQKLGFKNAYQIKKEILYDMGKFEEAYEASVTLINYNDSIYNEESSRQINTLKEQYEAEKKEAEIKLLSKEAAIRQLQIERQQQWLIIVGISVLVLVLIGFVIYFRLQQKRGKEKASSLEVEHRFLRSQLNPHFIFNVLGTIQNFILTNNANKAGEYLSTFAKMIRRVLEHSRTSLVTVEEEINLLKNYLELQQLNHDDKFTYQIDYNALEFPEERAIPPMMLQPFVENAVEHGLPAKGGHISISFKELSDQLIQIDVVDNGVGLAHKATTIKTDHQSVATSIIKERIALLKKEYGKDVSFEIAYANVEKAQGTHVKLMLPLKSV